MTEKSSRFTLRIPKDLKERLAAQSDRMGISINSFVVQILWSWLKENQR